MSNELTINENQDTFTQRQVAALTQIGVQDATPADLAVFLHQCQRTGLDPFARQIYMIGRRQKDAHGNYITKQTIQTGIDGFRLIARRVADQRHERLEETDTLWCGEDGEWHDVWLKKVPPTAAKATIIRGDSKFSAVALFDEYCPTRFDRASGQQVPTGVWGSKPALMIAKCAEALALRKAFPQDLSGLYTADETNMDDVQAEVVEEEATARKSYGSRARQMQPDKAPCTRDQAERIFAVLRDSGIASNEEAEQVLFSLTGAHGLTDPKHISRLDADNLLADVDFLKKKTMEALAAIRHPQQREPAPETVEATVTDETPTADTKEGK